MAKAAAREAAIFALFVALSVLLTWPLARVIGTGLADLGDPILNAWIIDWDLYAFIHAPLHLYDAPMYAPATFPLAYSENMVGIALLMIPFRIAGLAPIALYNVAMILGFAFSGYGATVLARAARASTFASLIAGILFGFCQFKYDHLSHLQIIWAGWLPLLLAALLLFWRQPSRRNAVFVAIAFAMNGLTNVHWLLFGSFAFVLTIVMFALGSPRLSKTTWLRLGAAVLAGGTILLPFLVPYEIVSKKYGMHRSWGEIQWGSATLVDWLVATGRSRVWGHLSDIDHAERKLFPGAMPLALLIAAVAATRPRKSTAARPENRSDRPRLMRALDALALVALGVALLGAMASPNIFWKWHEVVLLDLGSAAVPLGIFILLFAVRCAIRFPDFLGGASGRRLGDAIAESRFSSDELAALLWITIGFIGSFGIHSFLHPMLYRFVPIFRSTRTPARWAILTYTGLALFSAKGTDVLLGRNDGEPSRRPRSMRRTAVASVILLASFADVLPSVRWENAVTDRVPVYEWLRTVRPRGPVLELPMDRTENAFPYILGSTVHHVPIMNGYSGFEPPIHQRLHWMSDRREYNDVFLETLSGSGCQLVILHGENADSTTKYVVAFLRGAIAANRMVYLGRFDHGLHGDYLFALPENLPNWRSFDRSSVRDGAGFTGVEAFDRFSGGSVTYSALPVVHIDHPAFDEELRGPLTIDGWTLSPAGIARVDVVVEDGRYRYAAAMKPRPDIATRYPWYPKTERPGFELVLPRRPYGARSETDVQVVVTDRKGRVVHSEDRLIRWH